MNTATLVDSNVLIDVFDRTNPWSDRSREALEWAGSAGPLVINQVIYAEVSVRYSNPDLLEADLLRDVYQRETLPWPAAFLAGKVFEIYRARGGVRRSPLPDFFIGAHAAVTGLRLLTRDTARYRSYFPTVEVVAPE